MEGVTVGVQVHRVEVGDRPDLVTQERQVQLEAGAEQNSVELLGMPVGEGHGLVLDGCHPRPHRDSTLGYERQVLLGKGDAGGEQRWVRRRRSVLFRASTGFDNDLLELSVDLCCGQSFVREGSVSREDPIVGRHSRGEFRQDVALSALGHHDARRAELRELGSDLERADGTARDENTLAEVGKCLTVVVRGAGSRRAGEAVESGNVWDAG